MGLGKFFKKIGGGILKGVKQVDKVGDFIDENVPGGKRILVMVPVVGNVLAAAMDEVDFAERVISGPGKGKEKATLALERLLNRLREEGHDVNEDDLTSIIEDAVRVRKGYAQLAEFNDEGET